MHLPNWFKIAWWLALVAGLTIFLWARLPDLLSGKSAIADLAVFGVWAALLLAPLFTEVSLLGVTLKNEIEELKGAIAAQVNEIRADVRNAVDVRATFSPQFHMPGPVADAQLPQLEERVKAAVADALAVAELRGSPKDRVPAVDKDVATLFATRYNIETELRRIALRQGVIKEGDRPATVSEMLWRLSKTEFLERQLVAAIREVYAVCSPAIHGQPVTPAQVTFVMDVGPQLVAALQAIE